MWIVSVGWMNESRDDATDGAEQQFEDAVGRSVYRIRDCLVKRLGAKRVRVIGRELNEEFRANRV